MTAVDWIYCGAAVCTFVLGYLGGVLRERTRCAQLLEESNNAVLAILNGGSDA